MNGGKFGTRSAPYDRFGTLELERMVMTDQKTLFIVAGILTAFNSAALAGDTRSGEAGADWGGYHIGILIGGARNNAGHGLDSTSLGGTLNDAEASDPGFLGYNFSEASAATLAGSAQAHSTSFLGGLAFGNNYQQGQAVYGWEADWIELRASNSSAYSKNATVTYDYTFPPGETDNVSSDVAIKSKLNWLSTIRARVGILAYQDLMLFVTGGPAISKVSLSANMKQNWENGLFGEPVWFSPYNSSIAGDELKVGYTIGGGVEYKFSSEWSVRGDILYYDLGTAKLEGAPFVVNADYPFDPPLHRDVIASRSLRAHLDGVLFRVGISYQMGE
jgi:outer membrane immunogenic protein